jgi:hypothetical protein
MAEKDFFKANPKVGQFIHRPIWGSLVNPDDFGLSTRLSMAKKLDSWSHDKLPSLMQEIRTWVYNTTFPRAAAVFVHCSAGEDRTGEVSGAYYMKWLHWSWSKALTVDNHNENRVIRCASAYEMAWYCYYLQATENNPSWLGGCEWPKTKYCGGL